jgi:hypothetical protein
MTSLASRNPGLSLAHGESASPALLGSLTPARTATLWPIAICLTVACILRCWALDAQFASSDQVSMPHLIRHGYGLKWLFAHSYGPVPALLQRSFAQILSWLGLPIAETAARMPVVLVSVAQVILTYPLLRRMGCHGSTALAGMAVCAILPTLVADGHYAWAYYSLWLLAGTLALWATLAYLDDRRSWQLWVAGTALLAHCLSNCFAFALPLTLLVVWGMALRESTSTASGVTSRVLRAACLGFVVPCLTALVIIGVSWYWTGEGQIGRLLAKRQAGTTGWQGSAATDWWQVWVSQFGYLYVLITVAGLAYGTHLLLKGRRAGLLAFWALTGAAPLVAFTTPRNIGHPGPYLIDAIFCSGVLGIVLLDSLRIRFARSRARQAIVVVIGAVAITHMTVAGVDACLANGHLRPYTGVSTAWGQAAPDAGIKASGWFVRQYVPMNAIIMPLHTNRGMEAPVAEYYLGRRVIAGLDHRSAYVRPLLVALAPHVDIIIAQPDQAAMVEARPEFSLVCTITRDGEPVRFIYARPSLNLPQMTQEAATANSEYDRLYTPRHVPLPLPAPSAFETTMTLYRETLQQLKNEQALRH